MTTQTQFIALGKFSSWLELHPGIQDLLVVPSVQNTGVLEAKTMFWHLTQQLGVRVRGQFM